MSTARDDILARVRDATADVTSPPQETRRPPVHDQPGPAAPEVLDLFVERVADYKAQVIRVGRDEVATTVADVLRREGCRSVIVPDGVDEDWVRTIDDVVQVRRDSPTVTHDDLDRTDAVLTGSAVGIATTGTVVLDHGPDQGRREVTLVPDTQVCVVRSDQVVPDVPEAVQRLRPDGSGHPRPLTWISGPSATSDIELVRFEGVHGPRTLVVLLVDDS